MVNRFRYKLLSSIMVLLLLFLFTLALSAIVYAAPTAGLNPIEAYEGQTVTIDLSVNNFMEPPVNHVRIGVDSAEVVGMYDFISWTELYGTNYADWTGGPLTDNAVGIFRFDAKLSTVDEDEETLWEAEITDIEETETQQEITFTILNDPTPPEISNENPEDGDILLGGNDEQRVSIDAIDEESGIDEVIFMHDNCEDSGITQSVTLTKENETYFGIIDLSNCHEGDTLNFGFEANNNAGESSVILGEARIDETAPDVELILPAPDGIIKSRSTFTFNVEDNFDDEIECEIFVDRVSIEEGTFDEGENDVEVDLSSFIDGAHEWQVGCTDDVGLTEIEAGDFILDNVPPVIALVSPEEGLISDTVIDIEVTDNNGVDTVDYSKPLDTSSWTEGVNTLIVTATDLAGNEEEEEFTFTLDRTPPVIVLNSPADDSTIDYHANFGFTPSDVYDALLNCQVKVVAFGESAITEFASGESASVSMILGLGASDWNVECVDDAGNLGTSVTRTFISEDQTGPDLSGNKEFAVRSTENEFRITVTDISDIRSVQAYLFGDGPIDLTLDSGNDYVFTYTPELSNPLGEYSVRYVATDTNGYSSELVDEFELIRGYELELDLYYNDDTGEVEVSVDISYDDGGTISETEAVLNYPGGSDTLSLSGGSASHIVRGLGRGEHEFELVFEADNGYTYRKRESIRIGRGGPEEDDSGESSGRGPHSGSSQGIGGFYEGDLGSVSRRESSSGGQEESNQEESSGESGSLTVPMSPETRTPQPVAEATGLLGLTNSLSNWWILLILAGIIIALGIYAKKKTKKKLENSANTNNKDNIFR